MSAADHLGAYAEGWTNGDASKAVKIKPIFGNVGWIVIKAKMFKSAIYLVCAGLVLAAFHGI